jgi:hypothetical protein
MIEYKGLKWTEEKDDQDDMPRFTAASSWHDEGQPYRYRIDIVSHGPSKGMWRISGDEEVIVGTSDLENLEDAMELAAKIESDLNRSVKKRSRDE